MLEKEARKVMEEQHIEIDYKFGTMIEIPRAALTADELAQYAEFFSFGTNDLTQTTFGISRDDAESGFLMKYLSAEILAKNPFATIDRNGVGELMDIAIRKGRSVRPDLECGICGEHGGDPESIRICHELGLTYVSCSPFGCPLLAWPLRMRPCLIANQLVSIQKWPFFRNLCACPVECVAYSSGVNLRNHLCGVRLVRLRVIP